MTGATASNAQCKPAALMSPAELQQEADAVALRIALHSARIDDSFVVIELANRLVRTRPQELAS